MYVHFMHIPELYFLNSLILLFILSCSSSRLFNTSDITFTLLIYSPIFYYIVFRLFLFNCSLCNPFMLFFGFFSDSMVVQTITLELL